MASKREPTKSGGRADNGRTRFTVRISERLADYIDATVDLGLYGSSNAEVARKFIETGIAQLIKDGLIKIKPPEV